jgi:hypothetical protein
MQDRDGETKDVLDLVAAEARAYGHGTATLNHLLLALLQTHAGEMQKALGPKMKTDTLERMLRIDLGDTRRHAADLAPDGQIMMGGETARTVRYAKNAVTDTPFGAALLDIMLRLNPLAKAERSTTLDYIRMVLEPPSPGIDGGPDNLPPVTPRTGGPSGAIGWYAPYISLGLI